MQNKASKSLQQSRSPAQAGDTKGVERLTTHEVADLLRISPRTVYHLVSRGEIPYGRARGKLLFERHRIDAWVAASARGPSLSEPSELPAVIAGSHDPLLDWVVRDQHSPLTLVCHGSSDGLARLATRQASAAQDASDTMASAAAGGTTTRGRDSMPKIHACTTPIA